MSGEHSEEVLNKLEAVSYTHLDIRPLLPAIFMDMGDETPKIRLDYYDVIIQLEENYFKTIYEWHESRNMIYGCDHGGRGYDVTEFGDYFRTQKFNQDVYNRQRMCHRK